MTQVRDLMSSIVSRICREVNSPFSLAVLAAFNDDPSSLKKLDSELDPSLYLTSRSFAADYLCISFIKKYTGMATGVDLRGTALAGFKSAESMCERTNRRLTSGSPLSGDSEAAIRHARKKILDVIGPRPTVRIFDGCKWSAGATATLRRGSFPDDKMGPRPSVSAQALQYAILVLNHDAAWRSALTDGRPVAENDFEVVNYNKFVSVPKNAFTDRGICAEPTMNAFLQQGVGQFIRRRLRNVGIDLNDQTVNQSRAAWCHLVDEATIDLSMASDTMSRELVQLLLPPLWFRYLEDLRCPSTKLPDGTMVDLAKFSSMGNAYTFELESLIFWAIGSSFDETVTVYGDDIILSSECSSRFISTIEELGFRVNTQKSFTSGSFYESCGKHFFNGDDVTPIFQKEKLTSLSELVRCHNRVLRYGWRRPEVLLLCLRICGEIRRAAPDQPIVPFYADDGAFYAYPSDSGFLTEVVIEDFGRDGKLSVTALSQPIMYIPAKPGYMLAYKLRRGEQHSSTHPKGWDDHAVQPDSHYLRTVRIWLSSLLRAS